MRLSTIIYILLPVAAVLAAPTAPIDAPVTEAIPAERLALREDEDAGLVARKNQVCKILEPFSAFHGAVNMNSAATKSANALMGTAPGIGLKTGTAFEIEALRISRQVEVEAVFIYWAGFSPELDTGDRNTFW
ncbi:hypothetical protein V500_02405 [Pseudogymnoascus sp. VKM F-4518 (FW-2643)]|nr:hypothetical protein V500_02405 [Pseudogymnoascus sp. VKM F-4518 (FW-2643)]